MPLLYRSYINGEMGRFEEGALMQTTQLSYYKYEYPQTVKDSLDNILKRVDSYCFNMLREEYKFNDYIQKKASEEKRRKKDANDGFWIRTAAFQLGSALGRMFIGC